MYCSLLLFGKWYDLIILLTYFVCVNGSDSSMFFNIYLNYLIKVFEGFHVVWFGVFQVLITISVTINGTLKIGTSMDDSSGEQLFNYAINTCLKNETISICKYVHDLRHATIWKLWDDSVLFATQFVHMFSTKTSTWWFFKLTTKTYPAGM